MSKSLQKGILFAVCILLVCALGVTLFLADGTGMVPSVQEGQASAVAQNTATYTHGSNIGRPLPSDYTSVSDGTKLKAAIEANNKDIVLTNDVTLQTINAFWANNYLWNDNSQCFDSDGNGNTNLKDTGFNHKIYGQGYTIEVQGPHAATGEGMQQNSNTTNDYGGLFPKLGNNGAVYDAKIYITKGFSGQTQETWSSWTGSSNDEWLNVGGIAGSLIGNAVIDNVTVEIASGVKLASYKWCSGGSTSQYVRVGAIAGEINNTASISNVTVINNGRLESGQYSSEAKFSPDSERYYGAAGNVVGWISNATSCSINNVRVEGSGTLYSYYVANIANAIGSTVSVNNFYNNFTGTFDAFHQSSNTLGQGQGATSTLTVTNHYKKGALASTAGTDSTVGATNTLTVPNNLTLYFIPDATQDSERLGIAFSGTTYSSANDYTVTGLKNAEKTASGGFSAAPSGGTLALGLPVGANNWKTDGTFASITATPKFDPSSYAKLTKYDHGYVDPDNRTTNGTPIGTGEAFEAVFSPSGTITSGANYHLTNDIVITGFTGKEFSGTLDGNGHTIFITGANTGMTGQHIGGIVGTLTGTIKNVRVVLVNSVTANTSVSNANVGLVAGHINGGSLINVSVDIPADVTLKHTDSGNDSSLGGIAGSAVKGATVSGATFTNVTMNFNGTLSNIKTSGAGGGYWPFTSAFVGKPSVSQGTNSPANSATFNNIIIRGNGTFASQSSADDEPPYYAAIGIIQHKGVTNSTAAVYNVNGLIYDFNPQFADNQGATSGNHGACYGLFVNNNNKNAAQVQYYDRLVNYGSGGVYNASGKEIEEYAFNGNGNAPVPNPATNIKNITETVTNVTGSTVKAYFMPGDSASSNLTLVASANNWNGVTQLQLDGADPAVTSTDDGSNKVVNVAKSTAVNISGENLTLSPYNPYTVITASLVTDTKVYDGTAFVAQVSFAVGGSPLEGLTEGDDYNITYTDGKATGETNANVGGGTYSLTVTLTGTASDGTQYVFDDQGTKEKTFTYTITPLEVTGTWSVSGLKITYGDSDSTLDASHIVINLTDNSIPGGLTERYIVAKGFNSDYEQGTTQAGETVTISEVDFDITEDNGIIADNYTLNISEGAETTVEVQKKEITISAAADLNPDAAGHIEATYGGENYVNSQDSLAALLTWAEIGGYVNGRYGSDEIGFTITQVAHEGDTEAPGTAVGSGEWAKLPANDRYYITVESTNSNYTVAQGNYFTYYIAPAELTIESVVWSGTNNNTTTYNGSAQTFTVNASGLVEGDNLEDVISTSVTYNNAVHSGNIINAGTYTVTVGLKQEGGNYDPSFGVENTYDLTISPITLTPSAVNGTFTEYTSSNLPDGTDFVTSGILAADSGVTVEVTSWVNDPSTNVVGNGNYVAAGTYTANLEIQGDTNNNYTLSADTATFTVEAYNLAKATITVEATGLVYDGTEKTATVTVKAGEADITDLVTITGNTQTNAGNSYTVSISNKDSNTTGSKDADTTWSIAKATITIAGTDALTSEYSGEAVDPATLLSATYITVSGAASGENVYSMLTATSADGEILNYKEGGYTVNIALDEMKVGASNYEISGAASVTYTVTKKAVTVTWEIGDIIQGTDPDKVKATAKVTNNGGGILVGDEYTFTVTLPLKDGSGDYTTTTLAGTVINVTPSLTFTDPTDEGNYDITYSPVTLEWEVQQPEVAISVTAPTVEKTYAKGFVTEDDFLSNFTGIFTATDAKADLTSANFDITITKDGADGTTVGVGRLDVGTYTVKISAAAGSQYTIAADSKRTYTYTVTAEQWTATVAAPEGGLTYNGLDQLSSLVITPGTNNTCAGAPIIAAVVADGEMKNAGTYTVTLQLKTAEGEAYEGDNFVLNSGSEDYSAQIEIAKLKVKIEWEANGDLFYNGQAHTLTATITNKVETDNVTAIVEKHSGDNINVAEGGFAFTITGLENNELGNYTIDGAENLTSQAFYISPATLTVAEKEGATLSREYDGNTTAANSFLTADFLTVTGNAPSDDIYAMLNATVAAEKTILNADTYTVTITFNAQAVGASNYNGADINVSLAYTVNRKVITVAFDGYTDLTYNGEAHQITATVQGFVNDEATDITDLVVISGDSATEGEALNAGSYTATVSKTAVEGAYDNYTLASDATQKFTIAQATLTLTAAEGAPLSRDYDGNTTEASTFVSDAYVTVGGFVDDGSVYDLLTATVAENKTIKNADTYTITFALTNADGNYTLTAPVSLTYTVNPKTLTEDSFVWTDPEDYTYNGSAIAPTAAWAEGAIVTGDTVNITITISAQDGSEITDNQAINAGSYTAAATIAAGDASGNYKLVADVTHNFTIARKQVTITWTDGASDNFTYTYDGTAKAPAASVTEGAPEGTFDNINTLVTIDGIADNQAINAGSYTATITKVEFETAYPNYTIAEGSGERQFTIDPATISVSLSASGDNVENNTITLNVSGRVTASAFTSGEATLTEGENTVTITAAAADGATLPDIFFTLNGEPYLGTHYGTKVEGGELSVATANTNYKITVTQPLTLNITPSIVVQVKEEALKTAEYNYSKTYSADDFTGYFEVVGSDGSPVTGGSGEVTITNEEGGSVVQIKNAGTYTITYTYTPADWSGSDEDKPSTSYTFTITPATVTSVVLAEGEPSTYTFGDLRTDSTISVTVTYSDSTPQTLNATFETVSASGNYVSAGQEVTLTLTGDDNENANYMSIGEGGLLQHQVEIRVEKLGITASISYMGAQMVDNILTIEYAGDEVQANISVTLNGMIVGVETSAVVTTQIGNASTYKPELFLEGSYANNYTITNTGDLSVVVTPKEITVNWGDTTEFTYNGTAQAPVPTATGTFDNDTVNLGNRVTVTERGGSGSVTPINAGAYTATVAAFTDGNYKLSENATCDFTIGKGNATLSITNYDNISSKTYDSQAVNIAPVVSIAGGEQVTADVAVTIMLDSAQVEQVRNAGSYTVTLSIADDNNINDVSADFTFTISKASVSVSGALTTQFTYNGSAVDIDAMGASASTIYGNEATLVANATLNGEPAEMKNAGTYSVTFTLEGEGAGNYELATTGPVTVTINAKTVTITWGETTFTYNGTAQAPTFTVNNLAEGEELELTAAITAGTDSALTDDKAVNVGNYTATIAAASISGNYRLEADATIDFTIAHRQVEITWTDETFIYNGTAQAPTFTVKNLVEGDELELTAAITGNVTDGEAINAGDYIATIAAFEEGNYTLKEASTKTFTIAPKAASDSITVSGETVESGGTVEITTGENLRVDTAINNYIAQNGVAEGEYTVTATDSQGNEVDIDRVSSWAPGDYTISVNLGENFSGGEMTFTISVAEGTTTEIPDPPTTPSTPIVDDGGSGNNWLFPLIIAIECVIALALIAAIVITAIKRSKNA